MNEDIIAQKLHLYNYFMDLQETCKGYFVLLKKNPNDITILEYVMAKLDAVCDTMESYENKVKEAFEQGPDILNEYHEIIEDLKDFCKDMYDI